MSFAFGRYVLDPDRRELRHGADFVRLEPQAFDLLTYLVHHRDRVVGRDELVRGIWGGRIVTDAALTTRINIVRRAINDDGKAQCLIRTLPRKGFRFVAEVVEIVENIPSTSVIARLPDREFTALDKPTVAVVPFVSVSGDPESKIVAAGVAEEIATVLIGIPWLVVRAEGLAAPYTGWSGDMRRAGRELGVRYVVAGSVRRSGERLRGVIRLIEAETRVCLWAGRVDGDLEAAFEFQDAAATLAAAAIEPTLERAEASGLSHWPIQELPTRAIYLRALRGCYAYDAGPLLMSQELLDHAIERDPYNAPALATAAGCRQFLDCSGWAEGDRESTQAEAVELAHRALDADGDDPGVLGEAARVLIYFSGEVDTSISLIERALARNPSHARNWYWNGWIRLMAGEPDVAIKHFETSTRLNPDKRPHLTGLGVSHFLNGRHREAITVLNASLRGAPRWPTTYRFLAAAYAQAGDLQKARETIKNLKAITRVPDAPVDRARSSPFRDRQQSALYLDGLALATES